MDFSKFKPFEDAFRKKLNIDPNQVQHLPDSEPEEQSNVPITAQQQMQARQRALQILASRK